MRCAFTPRTGSPSLISASKRSRASNFSIRRESAALRAIRLTEVAALPPSVTIYSNVLKVTISSDVLKVAAEAIVYSKPLLASQLVLRVCTYDGDGVLKRVFSRVRVAAMPVHAVSALTQSCLDCIEYSLERMRARTVVRGWRDCE